MSFKSNNIVKKSNTLIDAHYKLNINEQRIIYKLISLIKVSDSDFKNYEIKATELINFIGATKNKRIYDDIRKYNQNLQKNIITIKKSNGEIIDVAWLSKAGYNKKNGTISFRFDPDLKQYLLNLKGRFTRFGIENIMKMECKYSPRIYELLKKVEDLGQREITLDELREILVLEKSYKDYNSFKKNVLLKTQQEINLYTDIKFSFKEIKEGKKVTTIIFIIKSKKINKQNAVELKESNIELLTKEFNKKYTANLHYNFIKTLVDKKGIDVVKKCIDELVKYVSKAEEIEKVFFDFTMRYGTDRAYIKTTSYKRKPQQEMNYEQREYDDDFFNSLYDNLTLEQVKNLKG